MRWLSKDCVHFSICACHPCAGAMLIFSVSFQFYRMILERNPLYKWPQFARKQLSVVLVVCARGVCTSLRLAIPPLTAQRSFACSVASLSQYPRHYLPGHCGLRHVDPAGCHLGWDRPSTWRAAHDTVPNTPANHPPLGLQDAVTHLR